MIVRALESHGRGIPGESSRSPRWFGSVVVECVARRDLDARLGDTDHTEVAIQVMAHPPAERRIARAGLAAAPRARVRSVSVASAGAGRRAPVPARPGARSRATGSAAGRAWRRSAAQQGCTARRRCRAAIAAIVAARCRQPGPSRSILGDRRPALDSTADARATPTRVCRAAPGRCQRNARVFRWPAACSRNYR